MFENWKADPIGTGFETLNNAANIGFGFYDRWWNKKEADRNQSNIDADRAWTQAFNMEQFNYMKDQNQIMRDREDNAIQRRMADLKAAGLSPLLAAGMPASAQQSLTGGQGQPSGSGTPLRVQPQNAVLSMESQRLANERMVAASTSRLNDAQASYYSSKAGIDSKVADAAYWTAATNASESEWRRAQAVADSANLKESLALGNKIQSDQVAQFARQNQISENQLQHAYLALLADTELRAIGLLIADKNATTNEQEAAIKSAAQAWAEQKGAAEIEKMQQDMKFRGIDTGIKGVQTLAQVAIAIMLILQKSGMLDKEPPMREIEGFK